MGTHEKAQRLHLWRLLALSTACRMGNGSDSERMVVQNRERRKTKEAVLSRSPGKGRWNQDIDPCHVVRKSSETSWKSCQPLVVEFERPIVVEHPSEDRQQPHTQCCPEVSPRVAFLTEMPKAETQVGHSKEEVREIKCLIKLVADIGYREDDKSKENRQCRYTSILS